MFLISSVFAFPIQITKQSNLHKTINSNCWVLYLYSIVIVLIAVQGHKKTGDKRSCG